MYDWYTAEMAKIFDRKFDAIKNYPDNYDSITNEEADAYIKGARQSRNRFFNCG